MFFEAGYAYAVCIANDSPKGYRFPIVTNPPPALRGISVEKFVAWTFKGNKWLPISIQVDEKNEAGNYVLEEGQPYTKGTDNGLSDENDEFSIRGTDLGQTFQKAAIPLEIQDQLLASSRLDVCSADVYLGSVLVGWSRQTMGIDQRPKLFDSVRQSVHTPAYRYEFNRKRPMLIGEVFLKSGGKDYPVFADSTFLMPIVPSLWILPGTKFDESDFESEIECWRSGPIRSIVAVGVKMNKFFSLVKLHLFSELVFYDDFFQIPTKIEMVFDASSFLDYGSGLAYVLRYPEGGRWGLSTNLPELPRDNDLGGANGAPKVTASQVAKDGRFRAWGTRPEGSFLAQVRVDPKAMDDVPPPFIVDQGMFDKDPWRSNWSWMKGSRGDLGVFLDISRVRKGLYDFALDLMLSDRANDGFTDFRPVSSDWQSL